MQIRRLSLNVFHKTTSISKTILILLILISVFAARGIYAAGEQSLDTRLDALYRNADKSIAAEDFQKADFYLARYLGLCMTDKDTKKSFNDLIPLLNKMSDRLKTTAFISPLFQESFYDFYNVGASAMWAAPDNNIQKDGSFFVRSNIDDDGKYVCVFVMKPVLETWVLMDSKNKFPKMVLPLGDGSRDIEIRAGIVKGDDIDYFKPVKLKDELNVQYVWHIGFHDLDKDKVPEIWVRYNLAGGSGFTQVLDIYKIKGDKELELLKRFEGEAEGLARRLEDGTVQTGYGFSADAGQGHMGYDMIMLQTWVYKGGKFVMTGEKKVKHILMQKDWEKYYFE